MSKSVGWMLQHKKSQFSFITSRGVITAHKMKADGTRKLSGILAENGATVKSCLGTFSKHGMTSTIALPGKTLKYNDRAIADITADVADGTLKAEIIKK